MIDGEKKEVGGIDFYIEILNYNNLNMNEKKILNLIWELSIKDQSLTVGNSFFRSIYPNISNYNLNATIKSLKDKNYIHAEFPNNNIKSTKGRKIFLKKGEIKSWKK